MIDSFRPRLEHGSVVGEPGAVGANQVQLPEVTLRKERGRVNHAGRNTAFKAHALSFVTGNVRFACRSDIVCETRKGKLCNLHL
jgi:hypothetical protein